MRVVALILVILGEVYGGLKHFYLKAWLGEWGMDAVLESGKINGFQKVTAS